MTPKNTSYTIAFYNTENLFDVFVDEKTIGNDFTPLAPKSWTLERYRTKIRNLGSVISKIGFETTEHPPILIGLAEIENDKVLEDLISDHHLSAYNYGFVHYNSSDERGIDVALLYDKDIFTLESSEAFPLLIEDEFGVRDYTRDILLVIGFVDGVKIHIVVNHWPSRHDGRDGTEFKRILASDKLSTIISDIQRDETNAQILVMGDFNDNPNSQSMMNLRNETGLYNTMESLWSYSRGSANHKFARIQFDQILISDNFLGAGQEFFKLLKSDIFDETFLTQTTGKYKGQPSRTYVGQKYRGGFSDHFPVFIVIEKEARISE